MRLEKNKKLGIVLSCYDKLDDLLAHLDILSFNPYKNPIFIGYMGHEQVPSELKKHHLMQFESPGFTSGTLVTLMHALRMASSMGIDYLVFRNADDWMFDHELVHQWFTHIVNNDILFAGYNWFSVNTFRDFAMNEVFISVPHFMETLPKAEKYILESDQRFNCEYKMAWWAKNTLKDIEKEFFRLPDREQYPGIGWENHSINHVFYSRKEEIPPSLWDNLVNNNRFFNHKWLMIGCHQNMARYLYYRRIRDEIPYAKELEQKYHFNRWITSALLRKKWNTVITNKSRVERLSRKNYPVRTKKDFPKQVIWRKNESSH